MSVASLVHWRIISNLLQLLLPAGQIDVISTMQELTYSPVIPSDMFSQVGLRFGDSHFHLDILLSRTTVSDFGVLEAMYGEYEFQLDVAIANYVFPDHWECFREQANDLRIYLTFGIHPHVTSMEYSTVQLHELLREPGCVRLGEVGLDFTTSCCCNPRCRSSKACKREKLAHQRAFPRKVLPIAKEMDLTLVVHCRDPNTGCAAREFLSILEDLHLTDLRIHRHCFTGNAVEAMTWIPRLPNVKFGFTSNLLRLSGAADVLCAIPMSNVLLESDAPYLPPTSRGNTNTPWALLPVARRIAELKGVGLSDVLAHALHI
ncbi:putative deoxyribonuclease TATDN2 [Crassostrea angulata]|uniref:putative deoxyribonuclease TATDN2 n=1 Tax=Magallana angulata TaxID=2784310 RepID=UPI0022B11D9D|nr:putative deoxyribonuclease TATDN2 [Crassostrea angulata]XP_052691759.1 putative deoxyribonuclease TATDN2 [Crassostrea angulata]